ncbi:transposase [Natranaerovirga hydrolytica]|uniref:transposase n=1 Tax=Natranaerovirga hydrolytica TaxID=680378 RepID=UPI001044EED6|nr:transposase [Natranaerovirga hydrolytica]
MKNNKKYTPEFKTKVVLEVLEGKRLVKEIVNEYEINYSSLKSWKKEVVNNMPNLLGRTTEVDIQLKETQKLNKNLEKQLEKTKLEMDFLKRKRFLIKLLQKSGRV